MRSSASIAIWRAATSRPSSNRSWQDAVIRNLEIIGEAAINIRSLDPATATQYPEWDQICAMRNRLTHGYFDINLEVVWRTARNDLPRLRHYVKSMLVS